MHKGFVVAGAVAALLAGARPAEAQLRSGTPIFHVAPYAGYMVFGNFLKGPIGTSLSNSNGAVYGAELGVHLTPYLAVVGNVARANADLQVGVPFLGGLSVGRSSMWLYDGGIQLSMPLGLSSVLPIKPFAQVGIGQVRHELETSIVSTKATNTAYNFGFGADVGFGKNLAFRLMAKDYVGEFDFKEATQLFDLQGERAHNWAFSAGIKIAF